ncbi:MAG: ABC transporter ATP-binding protein [Oscillospiraceae bacterium]|nr:ABC transporter ATP-binding protein [Oscillospiraceae bacterium]
MKLIFRSLGRFKRAVAIAIGLKFLGSVFELLLPYIFEHIIDDVVPAEELLRVVLWGLTMFAAAVLCRTFNVMANRRAVDNAHRISYQLRQALFEKTVNLTGPQFDTVGLPSLISRMTSDSYNVQTAVQQLQSLCVRAPIMLLGGVLVAMLMDLRLSLVLLVLLPVLIAVILLISSRGIPLYTKVQQRLDDVVRIMRESITGIRVVKALSKEDYEKRRFGDANGEMTKTDIRAATVMAIPGPFMQLCLNAGLTLVVYLGAKRVDAGLIKPGVILAFLTYFNMITMGVMGLNRIFVSLSKASASADRIDAVLQADTDEVPDGGAQPAPQESGGELIRFEHVDFSYGADSAEQEGFAGESREKALEDISFTLRRGESLGIIGPTGCGKTTVINLLMHFYDPTAGRILLEGRELRSYDKDALRKRFGVAFQNDMIFQDSLRGNVDFGRGLSEAEIRAAAEDAMAAEFIDRLPEGLDYAASIKGANLSGGQKQRIMVARALAARPEILVLDDSSSALDYRTDAAMRRAIREHHPDTTLILIAQRVSSVMQLDKILVMDNGRCIGLGSHRELMASCPAYKEICEIQMGDMS